MKKFFTLALLASAAYPAFAQAPINAPSWTVDEIIVTGKRSTYVAPESTVGTRSRTPIIQIPQSIQVLTRSLIEEQDRRSLTDALVNVSGVVANKPEEGLLAGPLVRGFPAEIYQDGLPMYGFTQAANDPTSLVGVARIDVVKGPTSTLYGGGVGSPLGGLINVETERPTQEVSGFAALRVGSYATYNPYGELNVPLSEGVSARIAAEYQHNESWIDQLKGERLSVQPALSFQLGPQTDLLIHGQYSRRSQLEYSGIPAAQALAGEIDRNAFAGAPNGQPDTEIKSRMVTSLLRHSFSDDLRLNVSARYYDSDIPQYGSFIYPDLYPADPATPTVYSILPLTMLNKVEETTFDANLSADQELLGGRHSLLWGVNFDHTDFFSGMGFDGIPVGSIDLADPVYNLAFGPKTPLSLTQTDRYQTMATYIQDQATYGRLHLTGSLRYTRLKFREKEQATDETYHRFSPRIGATVDIVPGIALYAGYATAFRGAFGLISLEAPKPETSRNLEAGLKFALSELGLSGTVALFNQRRDNVATPDAANPLFSTQTGRQRAKGIEADMVWEPAPALSLMANYAYTDAAVVRDNVIPVGDTLPRVPRHHGRLAARYRVLDGMAQGLSFGAGITAFSARELTLPNSVSLPGYAVVDAQASYDFDRYTVAVSGVNLGGRKAFDTYQYFAFPVAMPNQPRSVYLTLKARL